MRADPRLTWWLLAAGMTAALLLPLALVPIPPVLDYPNHLARMFVLAHGAADPFLSQVYTQHWAIIPNIGIDVVMPHMLAVMSVFTAGRIVLAVTLLLPVLGTICYSRAVLPGRSLWPLASGLVAYNVVFLLGFMNFLLAVGAALLAAAAWARWRERRPRATVAAVAVMAVAIFFIHVLGMLLLGLLLGAHELVALWHERREGALPRRLAARLAAGIAVFAPPVALYFASPLSGVKETPIWGAPPRKIYAAFGPFLNYSGHQDLAVAAWVSAVMAGCLLWRRAVVAPEAAIAFLALALLYPFMPYALSAGDLDARVSVMAGFLLFAGFAPRALPRPAAITLTAAFAAILLLRMAALIAVWSGQNQDVADFRQVIAQIAPASRVLVVQAGDDNPAYWHALPPRRISFGDMPADMHLPGLLVIERDSMWPLLFTGASKQPIAVQPAYRDLTAPEGLLPNYRLLARDNPPPTLLRNAPYVANWPTKYDYVLILNAGGAGDLASLRPDRLTLIDRTDIAALLLVRK